jgi:hypothetical protein
MRAAIIGPEGGERQMPSDTWLYTVGHSNHDLPRLLGLLRSNGVTAVADVRSSPYSRRLPQFNRPELEAALRREGMAYVFLGDQLGGRPRDPALYDADGRADYEKMRATANFQSGLDRLLRARDEYTVALLCGEADPLDCHRGLMITPALVERGILPGHIRKDGSVESQGEFEARLLSVARVGAEIDYGLFALVVGEAKREEARREAYRGRGRQIAFQRSADGTTSSLGGEEDPAGE